MKPPRLLLAAALALLLAACGGGDPAEPAPPVTSAVQTVGPTGATLTVDAAVLTLPADALPSATSVTLERQAAQPGELLRVRLAPAGQRLAAEAMLTLELAGAPADSAAFWVVDGVPLLARFTREGDRFTLPLRALGFGADGRRQPLAARQAGPLADAPADGGTLVLAPLDCERQAAALTDQLRALPQSAEALPLAERLMDALAATRQRCQELQVQQVQQAACAAYDAARVDVQAVLPTTLGELKAQVERLIGAESGVLHAGASCSPEPDTAAVLADRAEAFTAVLSGQLRRDDFASEAGARELRGLFAIEAGCQLLGLEDACTRLRTQIFPDVLDGMRRAAFDECRSRGTSLPVSQFLDLGVVDGRDGPFMGLARFRMGEVEADAVVCTAPELQVRVFSMADGVPEALPALDTAIRPLRAFNDYPRRGEVRPPRTGAIVLEGPVQVARCPDGTAPAADLVLRIADGSLREVARRPHDGRRFTLDSAPIDLAVPALLTAAGLDPATAPGLPLIVRQEGGACASGIVEGEQVFTQPVVLFELDLLLETGSVWAGTVSVEGRVTATKVGRFDSATDPNHPSAPVIRAEESEMAATYALQLAVSTDRALAPGGRVEARIDGQAATGAIEGRYSGSVAEFPGGGTCADTASNSHTLAGSLQTAAPQLALGLTGADRLQWEAGAGRYGYQFDVSGATLNTDECFLRPPPSGPYRFERLPLDLVPAAIALDGPAPPAAPVWEGETTRTVEITGEACIRLADVAIRVAHLVPKVQPEHSVYRCSHSVRVTWRLVRQ